MSKVLSENPCSKNVEQTPSCGLLEWKKINKGKSTLKRSDAEHGPEPRNQSSRTTIQHPRRDQHLLSHCSFRLACLKNNDRWETLTIGRRDGESYQCLLLSTTPIMLGNAHLSSMTDKLTQAGHLSLTVALTIFPLYLIETVFPQYG